MKLKKIYNNCEGMQRTTNEGAKKPLRLKQKWWNCNSLATYGEWNCLFFCVAHLLICFKSICYITYWFIWIRFSAILFRIFWIFHTIGFSHIFFSTPHTFYNAHVELLLNFIIFHMTLYVTSKLSVFWSEK